MLRNERGTASNIKSDATRTHVADSLSKVMQRLSAHKKTPEHGMVVFCGVVLPDGAAPGSETMIIHDIQPPKPLRQYLYRCDNRFHTDILHNMLKPDKTIGFLALDAKDAGWGLLRGDTLDVVDRTSSGVPGKHRQGGQSAKRFQRLREMHLSDYYTRVADTTRRHFLDENHVDGIIVSGPGHTKDEFAESNRLEYRLRNKILGCVDCSYAGPEGVTEAFRSSAKLLGDMRAVQERELVERLFGLLSTKPHMVEYGVCDVRRCVSEGSADTVLVADNIGLHIAKTSCSSCNTVAEVMLHQNEVSAARVCSCGAPVSPTIRDMIDVLAAESNTFEVINGRTEYGVMLHSLGGVAAMLRYASGRR